MVTPSPLSPPVQYRQRQGGFKLEKNLPQKGPKWQQRREQFLRRAIRCRIAIELAKVCSRNPQENIAVKGRFGNFEGLIIAVVEDIPLLRLAIAHDIVRRGGSVLLADSFDAWTALRDRAIPFDLMILDLVLDDEASQPRNNGIAILDDIIEKKIPARVVVWSIYVENYEYAVQVAASGVAGLLDKNDSPFDQDLLGAPDSRPSDWKRDFILDKRSIALIEAYARHGRFVCDVHNSHEIAAEEARAHVQIDHIIRMLKQRFPTLPEGEKFSAKKLLHALEKLERLPASAETVSWALATKFLRTLAIEGSSSALVEILKRIFLG